MLSVRDVLCDDVEHQYTIGVLARKTGLTREKARDDADALVKTGAVRRVAKVEGRRTTYIYASCHAPRDAETWIVTMQPSFTLVDVGHVTEETERFATDANLAAWLR